MKKRIVAITTAVVMLLGAATSAIAQGTTQPSGQQQPAGGTQGGPGMMGPGMMRGGMMEGGMMRHHAMAAPFRIIFALMDIDGDGTVSLQEWLAAHERIFKAMDAKKDGKLTFDEMQSFLTGQSRSGPQQ